jgi:hypothetical protein
LETYDAFISYPREHFRIAELLHDNLEKYARQKDSLRALRIFTDYNSLPVNNDLSEALKSALANSKFLILIASPETAASHWVNEELAYFYQLNKSTNNILIVLLKGTIEWDRSAGSFNKERTDALPLAISQLFTTEPLYTDLSQNCRFNPPPNYLKPNNPISLRSVY